MARKRRRTRPVGRASLARRKKETVHQYLARLYYTPDSPGSFGGAKALWRTVKLARPDSTTVTNSASAQKKSANQVRFKDVQNFLAKQRTYALFKHRRTKFPRNRSLPVPGPGYFFSVDIWDLRKFSKKLAHQQLNKSRRSRRKRAPAAAQPPPNYVLVGIDNFSKRIVAAPMPDKSQESVVEALESVLKAGFKFRILHSDNDKAFTGGKTQQFLEKNGAVHFTSRTDQHCYAAERANQVTVRNAPNVYRYMYVDPEGARKNVKPAHPRFQVGDQVLLSRPAQLFRKGYESTFYPECYTVHKVHTKGRERPVYNLIDSQGKVIKGRFYIEQLQKYIGH